jgi:hypothetical protein
MQCVILQAGVGPKAKITEFRVSDDAVVPPGTEITVRQFVPGQYLDIQGVTYVHFTNVSLSSLSLSLSCSLLCAVSLWVNRRIDICACGHVPN